jgi:hypothetical protein
MFLLQGASFILVSYLKVQNVCVIGMYPYVRLYNNIII